MTALVAALATLLADAGVGDYATDRVLDPDMRPIVVGAMPPTGAEVVLLTTYPGGPEPDSRNGWEYPRLQVRVRAADALAALEVDRAVFAVLQAPGPQSLPGDEWYLQDCYALQSEAAPMGVDANGRHEFARNYQLSVEPTG